jgi:dCTP diphosphatase
VSIAIEASELMELFQWPTDDEADQSMKRPRVRNAAASELADVLIYCLAFANRTGIDLSPAVMRKIAKNNRRYPIRRYRGRF